MFLLINLLAKVIVVNHGGLLNAFSREIGSHKENGQKQVEY
jgi:hypothetical protein